MFRHNLGDAISCHASAGLDRPVKDGDSVSLVVIGGAETARTGIHTRKTAGFTVWVWRQGRPQPIFCDTEKEAAEISIRLD